mgnify:CR=1 FL=1
MTERILTNGKTEDEMPDYRETDVSGQQKAYIVLTKDERSKGFIRPIRRSYIHAKCGVVTSMGLAIAETYARDPKFYGSTFCAGCLSHFPVSEFKWDGTNETVGS